MGPAVVVDVTSLSPQTCALSSANFVGGVLEFPHRPLLTNSDRITDYPELERCRTRWPRSPSAVSEAPTSGKVSAEVFWTGASDTAT